MIKLSHTSAKNHIREERTSSEVMFHARVFLPMLQLGNMRIVNISVFKQRMFFKRPFASFFEAIKSRCSDGDVFGKNHNKRPSFSVPRSYFFLNNKVFNVFFITKF